MPRNSNYRRRGAPPPSTHVPAPQPRPASSKCKPETLFQTYANRSSNTIEPEGIVALCKDLRIEADTDVRILILAWKMGAERQGYFSLNEWQRGLKSLQADTIDKIKKALSALEKDLMNPAKKKKTDDDCEKGGDEYDVFYEYAFQYCLTEERQRTVDVETACVLLNLVLGPRCRAQVALFTKYLEVQTGIKAVTMDQWVNFGRFCEEITFPGLENYDSYAAWPVIIDEFVDWLRLEGQ